MAETSFCSRFISSVKKIFKKSNNTATITVKSLNKANPNPTKCDSECLYYVFNPSNSATSESTPQFIYRDDTFIDYDDEENYMK